VYVEPDIAYTITTLARLSEHGGIHPEGVVDYLMNIQGVNTAVHAVQRHSNVKVSIRSRTLNVGEIAGKLGGGGHKAAAGFTAQGAPDGVVSQVLKILTE
jgi:phosphoesterase RecJ-like protein